MRQATAAFYTRLHAQAAGLFDGESDFYANCANLAALLFLEMENINWVGFYWRRGQDLVLGSFQGKPACARIPPGQGVCGTAAVRMAPVVVDNVHEFEGHIACDGASNSEVVVPIISLPVSGKAELLGVLDVDSPEFARFDLQDAKGLAALVTLLLAVSNPPD